MSPNLIAIEVAYATPSRQILLAVQVPMSSNVQQAVHLSGLLTQCPEINLTQHQVGIFGEIVSLTTPVKVGDRIEIYRSLIINPKQARRLRASSKK
jgi:putative ubiquitin-RnfH superfamily antitoxin RatB of RatAB toxin-antitoxin module